MMQRQTIVDRVRAEPDVSVLIIGGGINGAGLLRELALQGVGALLVEKADFCSGASAASSRMIHGGLRYLEFGEFRLVKESLKDRNLLLKNAPHYVFPLPTTIPIFCRFSGMFSAMRRFFRLGGGNRPPHRGSLMVKAGLTFYDIFTRKNRLMPKHKFTSCAASLARRPALNKDITCTATYYDAWISYPERLGLELILDAAELCPDAMALNYVSLAGAEGDTAVLRDETSGETLHVRPKIVVNATGGWIDFTNRIMGLETTLVGGTKGAHLVIDNEQLYDALDGEMIYYETPEGRVAVALPWLGKALIGSTDIRVDNPDDVRCTEEEVDYMLESLREVFPGLQIDRSQILSRFTGVRPLRYSGESATVQVSRDHFCAVNDPTDDIHFSVYSMTGGKWTTFRAFSEQVTDRLLDQLALHRTRASEDAAIGGGKDFPLTQEARKLWIEELAGQTGLSEDRIDTLLRRYGMRAGQVAAFLADGTDRPLEHHDAYSRREIEFIVRSERVVHVTDLVLRRTAIALLGELNRELLRELTDIMASVHEWSNDDVSGQIDRTVDILLDRFGIDLHGE